MRNFINIINLEEARRNPDINRKEHVLDVLRRFENKDVYVSFTHDVGSYSHGIKKDAMYYANKKGTNHNFKGAKIGINPSTEYSTPVGIYAYPIAHVLAKGGRVEFGAERPYVWVFEPKGKMLDLATYTEVDLDRDLTKLHTDLVGVHKAVRGSNIKTPGGFIWNITRLMARDKTRYRLKAAAEEGADDRSNAAFEEFLKHDWPEEREAAALVAFQDSNYEDEVGEEDDEDDRADRWDAAFEDFKENEWDDTDAAREAFEANYFDEGGHVSDEDIDKAAPPMWNAILRKLGYSGITDSKGEGIIHGNEPTQAVFLSKSSIQTLALVDNIKPEQPKSQEEIWYKQPKALLALMRRGGMPDADLITVLDHNHSLVPKLGFDNLPEAVKEHIRDHAADYFKNSFGQWNPKDIGLNDEQTIRLFADQPGWAAMYTTFSPVVRAYVCSNVDHFRTYFDQLPLTDAEKLHALNADPDLWIWMDETSPSPFFQKWMILKHPREFMNKMMWAWATTTDSFVAIFVSQYLRGVYKKRISDFLCNLLNHDSKNHPDSFRNFLACFAKLPARSAVKYCRDSFGPGASWRNTDILRANPNLKQQMIALKPACASVFENPVMN